MRDTLLEEEGVAVPTDEPFALEEAKGGSEEVILSRTEIIYSEAESNYTGIIDLHH